MASFTLAHHHNSLRSWARSRNGMAFRARLSGYLTAMRRSWRILTNPNRLGISFFIYKIGSLLFADDPGPDKTGALNKLSIDVSGGDDQDDHILFGQCTYIDDTQNSNKDRRGVSDGVQSSGQLIHPALVLRRTDQRRIYNPLIRMAIDGTL